MAVRSGPDRCDDEVGAPPTPLAVSVRNGTLALLELKRLLPVYFYVDVGGSGPPQSRRANRQFYTADSIGGSGETQTGVAALQ